MNLQRVAGTHPARKPGRIANGENLVLADLDPATSRAGKVPLLLRVTAAAIFIFPSSMIIKPIGAAGTVPLMLAMLLFVLWAASCIFALHDPIPFRHPGRIALGLLLLGTCISYVGLYSGWTGPSTVAARAAADRWVMLLLGSSALVFVATETIRTMADAMVYIRAMLAGGAFCCLVACTQFFLQINPMEWFHFIMPGFSYNGGDTTFQNRGALLRVAGSTFTPIELAVVSSMLLPLSIWRGLFDTAGRKWMHWAGTFLLIFAIAATISRSGILGISIALAIFIPFMPVAARKWTFVVLPIVIAALFMGIPGLVSTIYSSLTPEEGDPSISTRTNNYPRVAAMFEERPIIGAGPGNYLPANALHILDNQYLNATVTMGMVGLVCTIAYFVIPGVGALLAARIAKAPALRSLAAAVAAAGLVGTVCSLTFDSLSFPVFALTYPLFIGLGGAVWIMTKNETVLTNKGVI
jgi:O-antigen ligase